MLPYRDSRLTQIAIAIFFVIVAGYAYFEARGMLFGPRINVSSAVTEVTDPFVVITGKADRISSLKMNGADIPVTEEGVFEQPYLLAPGLNRIMLVANDKYGRSREKVIQIVYTPPAASPIPSAPIPETPATTSETASTTTHP